MWDYDRLGPKLCGYLAGFVVNREGLEHTGLEVMAVCVQKLEILQIAGQAECRDIRVAVLSKRSELRSREVGPLLKIISYIHLELWVNIAILFMQPESAAKAAMAQEAGYYPQSVAQEYHYREAAYNGVPVV